MNKNAKIKVGILGCANIAVRSLMPEFQKHTDFELTAIASRDLEKAKLAVTDYRIEICSYENLVENKDIDLIYIPLPNGLHKEWVIKSIENGKNVLCEKSLGVTLDEVEQMLSAARKYGKALIENFQFQYHSQQKFIKDLIKSELGEVRSFRSSFGFPPFKDKNNIRYQRNLGGGALLDAGAYTLKAAQFFLEEKFEIVAAKSITPADYEVDIFGGVLLESKSGVIAQTAFGFDNFYQNNIEIWGSKGKLTANRIFTAPPDFKPEIIVEKQNEIKKYDLPCDNHFAKMLDHISQSIKNQDFESDYLANHNQAQLIHQFNEKIKNEQK